ncbi:unnamed protein product [Rotaria sp. Silwood1]|nr:unnamed protein product [Rotaria sp. Silwood1]
MQAKDLRILIGEAKPINEITDPAQRDARAHIINAFSMMNADGSAPRSVDFHSFRGAFTPEFFPRRFALKDSIYSQRLDLLAFLLRNALYRFSTCSPPIKYCEFSVGCGDLSRPWIFDILLTFSNAEPISELKKLVNNNHFPWLKTDGFERAIDYRFLAGFNRRISRVSHGYSVDEAVAFLFEVPHNAIHVPIVLSTDDDGIWPIDKCPLEHQEHHSLAAEYCRAITTRFITKNHLKNMIKNSKRFCFTYGKALPKEKSQKTITVRDINEGDYFPTDIIVHPDVLRMLLARIPRSDIDLYPCLKYYQTLYKLKIPPSKSRDFDDDESRDSDDDWKKQCQLIGPDQRSELVHNACENVYLQLMNDTPGQGARMQVTKDNESFLFCSEVPNNRKGVPNFLLSTIREFITKNTSKATIFSFLPNIDVNNSKVISDLQNIDKSITNRKIEIFIHTNTEKDITIPRMTSGKLLINNKPNQRTGPAQEQIQCALYAVCPHGSVATAALHFIAQHSDNKSLVFERQHLSELGSGIQLAVGAM